MKFTLIAHDNKKKVGNYSLIGSGAVVLNDIPENSIYIGNPAKKLEKNG